MSEKQKKVPACPVCGKEPTYFITGQVVHSCYGKDGTELRFLFHDDLRAWKSWCKEQKK